MADKNELTAYGDGRNEEVVGSDEKESGRGQILTDATVRRGSGIVEWKGMVAREEAFHESQCPIRMGEPAAP